MIRHALLLVALLALAPAQARAGSDLNGTTGFWELASDLGFDAGANFPITVSAWVRPDTVSGVDTIVCIEDKGDQNRATSRLSNGAGQWTVVASGDTGTNAVASKTATAGRWYHVVVILDDVAANAFVWVDGSFLGGGSGTNRVLADLDTTTLGCEWSGASAAQNFFDGVITDVAVWSVALREDEVQRITKDPRHVRNVRPESLVLHCPPEAMTGTRCVDMKGAREFTKNGTIADSSDNGPNGFTPPGLGSWTPASLTGLVAWLKGDAGVTGSAPVTAWADQSGAGNDLDNTGTGDPATVTDGYGGKTGVRLTSDSLYGEPAPATVAPFYLLMVADTDSATSNDAIFAVFDKDVDDQSWILYQSAAATVSYGAIAGGPAGIASQAGVVPNRSPASWEVDEVSGVSRRISANGGQQGTNTNNRSPAGADRFSIGRVEDATPHNLMVDCTYYELVLVTSAPTDAQRCLWFRYVRTRWGVRGGPWRYE